MVAAMLEPPVQPAEHVVEREGNDHGRVLAKLCPIYASHGSLTQHAPHWKSERKISPSHEVI